MCSSVRESIFPVALFLGCLKSVSVLQRLLVETIQRFDDYLLGITLNESLNGFPTKALN